MMRFSHLCFSMLAACALASPLEAADGVLIVQKVTTGAKIETHQVQIEKDRMRAEIAGQAGAGQVIVFDGAKQVLWMINTDKKTYNEMTKADMDAIGGQMASAMSQMEEAMKNMPPAQRAQMEAMMRGRMGAAAGAGAAPTKPDFRKSGTDKVGRWTCDKYDGFENNQKTSEVCTVDPKDLGFAVGDFEVTRQLATFFQKLAPQQASQMFSLGKAEEQGYSGIPVRRITGIGGQQTTMELTDVSRQNFPASLFEVPPGFQKEAMGMGMGGGRRGR